jgi:hypothetical protein
MAATSAHVFHDIAELCLECFWQRAVLVKTGNAGDEQELAHACRKGERRSLDAWRRREVLDF